MSGASRPEDEPLVQENDKEKEDQPEELYKAGIPLIPDRDPKGKVKMTSTKDAAVMALLCMSNGFECGLLWPFMLHIIVQGLQFFLVTEFFAQKVLPLSSMFKSPQLDLVQTILMTAVSTSTKIEDFNASTFNNAVEWQLIQDNNSTVNPWIYARCQLNLDIPQKGIDILMIALVMLLFGKFMGDVSSFIENVNLLLFQMESGVDADRDKEECHDAIKKALSTPASKTSITSVAMHVKIIIVVLIYLPHFICQAMIVFCGAQFVLVQPTLGVMIKSALKIYFIVSFSGIMLKAYTGENMKKLTSGAMMSFKSKEGDKPNYGWWQSVLKVSVIFVAAVCFSIIYVFAFGGPVHQVGKMCDQYVTTFGNSDTFPLPPTCLPGPTPLGTCGFNFMD